MWFTSLDHTLGSDSHSSRLRRILNYGKATGTSALSVTGGRIAVHLIEQLEPILDDDLNDPRPT